LLAEAPVEGARLLTLGEALDTARQHHPELKRALAVTRAERARAAGALAPLLPQLDGTASYQRTTANFVPRPGFVQRQQAVAATQNGMESSRNNAAADPFELFNFWNFGLTASQLIYDFGASHGTRRASRELVRAQEASEQVSERDVELAVRTAFFQARAQSELVRVARENLANQERHLAQVQAFVDVGTRPEIDLAQVRTEVANARVQLIQADNALAIGKARLNQAMGVEGAPDYELAGDTLPALPEEDEPSDQVLRSALAQRPELSALARRAEAQRLLTRAAKGGYGPRLSASTSFTEAGLELDDLRWNWNAGVQLSWRLFDGAGTRAAARESEAIREGVLAEREAMRQAVHFELQQARLDVRAAKAVLGASGEALVAARERLKLAEGRYAAGVGNVIELGDAQLALTQAEAQQVQAEYSLAIARALLLRALGSAE
jgi:outer membrane protein